MNTQPDSEQPIDPKLKELLKLIREVPPREPQAEARGRAKYFADVDTLFDQDTHPIPKRIQPRTSNARSSRRFSLSVFQQRLAFTSVMAVMAILLVLFGGAGVTAYAAQSSLPGDALYPVKTGLELTQAGMARDAARQAQLYLNFAERRLDEIALLIADGRFDDIDQATLEFETNVQRAINTLNTVSAGDPARAQELATQISNALSRYAEILRGLLTSVPDTVKPAVEKAILTSETEGTGELEFEGIVEQITPEGWIISGRMILVAPTTEIKGTITVGVAVEVHAIVNDAGSLSAREIEVLESGGEDINDNQSGEDSNSDDNGIEDNANENENESLENQNDNLNSNDNDDDDNGNDNEENDNSGDDNEDSDSNQNDNDDDNENDNDDNDNDHDNDNGDNDNDDGDGDGNDNDND